MQNCPVCRFPLDGFSLESDNYKIACPRCGQFEITRTAAESIVMKKMGPRSIANICGFIWRNSGIALSASNIYSLLEIKTPSFRERAEKLLRALEKANANPGQQIVLDLESNPDWLSKAYASDDKEVAELLDYLAELGFIRKKENMRGPFHVAISPQGFVHLDTNREISPQSKQGYVVLGVSEDMRQVFNEAIAPAISGAGYEPYKLANPEISDEAVSAIRRSRFLLADLSSQAAPVYYQAGLATGLGLCVLLTCKEDAAANLPIELGAYSVILWRPDNLASFKLRLQNRIEAILGQPKPGTTWAA